MDDPALCDAVLHWLTMIKSFRNTVLHECFAVDWALVRPIAEIEVPKLHAQALAIVRGEFPDVALMGFWAHCRGMTSCSSRCTRASKESFECARNRSTIHDRINVDGGIPCSAAASLTASYSCSLSRTE